MALITTAARKAASSRSDFHGLSLTVRQSLMGASLKWFSDHAVAEVIIRKQ